MEYSYNHLSEDIRHLAETVKQMPQKVRGPGRPEALTEEIKPLVLELYRKGYGYRRISKILLQSGISIHWRTIQRFIKNHNRLQIRPIQVCVYARQ